MGNRKRLDFIVYRSHRAACKVAAHRSFWLVVFVFLVASIRIGTLDKEVIDWDESTFILMGADVLRGNLPYVHLFDVKPPLLFFALAAALGIFGDSLATVRAFGGLCLLAICVATFEIGARLTNVIASGLAVVLLLAMSTSKFAQFTQTEHLAMAFIMGALWLVLGRREQVWAAFCVGFLVSLAMLTRTNLAFTAIAFFLYYAFWMLRQASRQQLMCLVGYLGGSLIPVAVLILIYWANGALTTLILGTVLAPLAYATEQTNPLYNLILHGYVWHFVAIGQPYIFVSFSILFIWGVLKLILNMRNVPKARETSWREEVALITLIFAATFLSVLMSGTVYTHYWNQLLPFGVIIIALALEPVHISRVRNTLVMLPVVATMAGAVLFQAPQTLEAVRNLKDAESRFPIKQAAARIEADWSETDTVWALSNHLILWYLGEAPISPILVHPSNIVKDPLVELLAEYDYIQRNEFARVLDSRPKYIVLGRTLPRYLTGAYRKKFVVFIRRNYRPIYKNESTYVLKRNTQTQ